jgi:hypothetical protein
LKDQGLSNRQVAVRLGVTEQAVRKVLIRIGWTGPARAQAILPMAGGSADPKLSAFPNDRPPSPPSSASTSNREASAFPACDRLRPSPAGDPSARRFDRLMACLGRLDKAAPLFRPGAPIPGAGVLLAIPALVAGGVSECAREVYGSLGPAFFGRRTMIVALMRMAGLRIKRPEGLKEHPPATLGRMLGWDRAPEGKTLRRKLSRWAGCARSTRFGRAPAACRVAARGAGMGFL